MVNNILQNTRHLFKINGIYISSAQFFMKNDKTLGIRFLDPEYGWLILDDGYSIQICDIEKPYSLREITTNKGWITVDIRFLTELLLNYRAKTLEGKIST